MEVDKFSNGEELKCKCCGLLNFRQSTYERFTVARILSGVSYKINSACRCETHNATIGGVKGSSHECTTKEATAMDIACTDKRARFKIIKGLILAGFTRIGIYKTFIHADDDETKDPEVVWLD